VDFYALFFNQKTMNNLQKLSDKQLYSICKKWGAAVLEARRKFAGLLPEVYRREAASREKGGSWVQKRGFSCVYEFAARKVFAPQTAANIHTR
jgi:hypothetical protein